MNQEEQLIALRNWISRNVFAKGMRPISPKACIRINVAETSYTLGKLENQPIINESAPSNPDLTFTFSQLALLRLVENPSEDVAEIGISILKLLVEPDPKFRASIKVHLGLFDLMRLGYLSVLPLGGAAMVSFLASHGIKGIGRIKEIINNLRST